MDYSLARKTLKGVIFDDKSQSIFFPVGDYGVFKLDFDEGNLDVDFGLFSHRTVKKGFYYEII